jgi:replication factor A1
VYKVPLPELKEKIIASGKLSADEVEEKIKFKINELSGLISEEGAAHIIANELGVELVSKNLSSLKIKEIYGGMRNVSTVGKVVRKFEVREFTRNDKVGKVGSLILGDETATIRLVLWGDQANELESINDGDIVKVTDSYIKDNNGNKEVHAGDRSILEINPEGVEIESVRSTNTGYSRVALNDLQGGEQNVEILGTVVQAFDPRFFNVHPETGRRIREGEEGDITPALSYVMNVVIDDGTSTIRVVFWKNQTNLLLEKDETAISAYKENPNSFEDVKTDLLGEQFVIKGSVKKNEMFNRLELSAQLVEKADPQKELDALEKSE